MLKTSPADKPQPSPHRLEQELARCRESCEQLRESSQLLQATFDAVSDGVCLLDMEGQILRCNAALGRLLGKRQDKIIGRPCYQVVHGTDTPLKRCPVVRMKQSGRREAISLPIGRRHFLIVVDPVYDSEGNLIGAVHILSDITRRKKIEEALKQSEARLRTLSSRLLGAQEEERKRIALELHDGIGQSLSAIKFTLETALARGTPGLERDPCGLESVVPMVQAAVEEVRRIGRNLRPSILDDLGMLPTVSWLCREFESVYTGIRLDQQIEIGEQQIPEALKIHIYRILQEALNNSAKHSGADRISVFLGKRGKKLELMVGDNGRGLRRGTESAPESSGSGTGLTGMRERAELSGGTLRIESSGESGTTVKASWPAA